MGDIELKITPKDWISVLAIGVVFSGFLSLLAYQMLGFDPYEGAIFGILLGFLITFFSLLFITGMNRYLLPKISKSWWNTIAALFSFLSGFLGTITTYAITQSASLTTVPIFSLHPFQSGGVVGILTYLIGALIYRFVKARNEKEHLDHLFIQSRIRSLETQLNPHFLFNALNSLAELIHQDPRKAEETVLKISSFLRNTMREKPLIPLREELKNVQDYLELENIRFNGAITLATDVDEAVMNRLIPKFSIQLLAENAIKHGYDTSVKHFTLSIQALLSDTLHIRVSNTGRPIAERRFGIGLSNLQERLSHLCQGSVSIEHTHPPTYLIDLKECHESAYRG